MVFYKCFPHGSYRTIFLKNSCDMTIEIIMETKKNININISKKDS